MKNVDKVFISSTQADLEAYREVAIHVCQRLSLMPIPMEDFGPDERPPVDVCMSKVDEASVYLGLYAHRYGFMPEGSDISMTEMEYDRAIENGIPVVLFMIDDEYPWLPRYVDDGDKKTKLSSFKSRIGAKHTVQKFGVLEPFDESKFEPMPEVEINPSDEFGGDGE